MRSLMIAIQLALPLLIACSPPAGGRNTRGLGDLLWVSRQQRHPEPVPAEPSNVAADSTNNERSAAVEGGRNSRSLVGVYPFLSGLRKNGGAEPVPKKPLDVAPEAPDSTNNEESAAATEGGPNTRSISGERNARGLYESLRKHQHPEPVPAKPSNVAVDSTSNEKSAAVEGGRNTRTLGGGRNMASAEDRRHKCLAGCMPVGAEFEKSNATNKAELCQRAKRFKQCLIKCPGGQAVWNKAKRIVSTGNLPIALKKCKLD